MNSIFPEQITSLRKVEVPGGVTIYISQADQHVVYYLTASEDLEYPEHEHAAQFAVVLEGRIDITTATGTCSFVKGDRYCLPAGTKHCVKIHAGFAEMSF